MDFLIASLTAGKSRASPLKPGQKSFLLLLRTPHPFQKIQKDVFIVVANYPFHAIHAYAWIWEK